MRDLWVDVQSLLSNSQGPQSQGHCRALKSQVSESMNYENSARYRVFDPLDVRLRVRKQNPFHSTPKDSLQPRHPPSHQPLPSRTYTPSRWLSPIQQGVGLGSAPYHCVTVWRQKLVMRDLWMDVPSLLLNSQGPQSQGHHTDHRALKFQVSESMNDENSARNHNFGPLDVRLREPIPLYAKR